VIDDIVNHEFVDQPNLALPDHLVVEAPDQAGALSHAHLLRS
jgi:hypothetical protein